MGVVEGRLSDRRSDTFWWHELTSSVYEGSCFVDAGLIPQTNCVLWYKNRAFEDGFRNNLENRTTNEFLPHAQTLYNWLVRPLEPELASAKLDALVFVPDGALRTIPQR